MDEIDSVDDKVRAALLCQRAKIKETNLEYEQAIEDYKEALRIDDGLFNAAYSIAVCLQRLDKQEESLDWFQVAIDKDIGKTSLYELLGNKKAPNRNLDATMSAIGPGLSNSSY